MDLPSKPAAGLGPSFASPGSPAEINSREGQIVNMRVARLMLARRGVGVAEREGASSSAGNVVGPYLHGLFANDALRRAWRLRLADRRGVAADPRWGAPSRAAERYDRLADLAVVSCELGATGKLVDRDLTRPSLA